MTDKPVTAVSERERARECAIEVLKNCAAHYAKPGWFRSGSEQEFIDMAINNATKIVDAYRREGVRQALQWAALQCESWENVCHGYNMECHQGDASRIRARLAELEGADQS